MRHQIGERRDEDAVAAAAAAPLIYVVCVYMGRIPSASLPNRANALLLPQLTD